MSLDVWSPPRRPQLRAPYLPCSSSPRLSDAFSVSWSLYVVGESGWVQLRLRDPSRLGSGVARVLDYRRSHFCLFITVATLQLWYNISADQKYTQRFLNVALEYLYLQRQGSYFPLFFLATTKIPCRISLRIWFTNKSHQFLRF